MNAADTFYTFTNLITHTVWDHLNAYELVIVWVGLLTDVLLQVDETIPVLVDVFDCFLRQRAHT